MELFASDLHINQILVDNSVGAMRWIFSGGGEGERWEAAAFKGIDLSQPLVSRVNFSTLPPPQPSPRSPSLRFGSLTA